MRYVLILKFTTPRGSVQWVPIDFSTRDKAVAAGEAATTEYTSYTIVEAD